MKNSTCFTTKLAMGLLLACIALISSAQEKTQEKKGSIELKMIAQKEITVENEEGEKEVKREAATKVVPGDHVIYTVEYKNVGEENADSVVINNPIPENMHYVPGTAEGINTEIIFSIDGGKSFDKAENLKVVDDEGNERPATAKDYTNIRWTLTTSVKSGEMGTVSYRAELE